MVLDASVWVSQMVGDDVHHVVAIRWLDRSMASFGFTPVIPALALAEVAGAVARRAGHAAAGARAVAILTAIPRLRIVHIDPSLGAEAAELAARLRLRGADAIYVATALRMALPLVTLDAEIAERARDAVRVIRPAA